MPKIPIYFPDPITIIGHTPYLPALPLPIGGLGGHLNGTPIINISPVQVAGLIPLMPCDSQECREICTDGWKNIVFGELVGGSYQINQTYENDWNTFLIDVSLYAANPTAVSVTFELEKYVNGAWVGYPNGGVNLTNNVFGQIFPLGSIAGHPTYAGYAINWGSVLLNAGAGCYRFKAKALFTTYVIGTSTSGGTQASCTFALPNNSCLTGAIIGTLQTISGSITASYSIVQMNTGFTEAQNVQFIVNLINAGSFPYTATYNGGNSFTITGQSYASNNGATWSLQTYKTGLPCDYQKQQDMLGGVNPVQTTTPIVHEGCLVSPPFDLKEWNCFRAHGTVKFETWLTGIIGDPYTDYKKHDLCGILWYDSIRVKGFFGFEKSPTYLKNNLKWGSPSQGKIEKVSDEQTQRWEYLSGYMPEYIHSRFATFGMMSDKLFASDYNINNSNYTYKRKNVIYDSGYEPEYIDKEAWWQRKAKSKVQVFFNRGVQSVIKSLCCST